MPRQQVNLLFYTLRIERASNKEEVIKNILNELNDNYSLTRDEKIQVISFFERYFRDKEEKNCTEQYVPYKTEYSRRGEPCYATDNSAILDALDNIKRIL